MEIVQAMKLHIHPGKDDIRLLTELMSRYVDACNDISRYVFEHDFILNFISLQKELYQHIRSEYGLKSQFTISSLKTVTARYQTVESQMARKPYRYKDADDQWHSIPRTLEWLTNPIRFSRPQADFVRNRDYSFVKDSKGEILLSLNTLGKRIKTAFDVPDCFSGYFDNGWKFGGGKLVTLNGEWYFHISMTKEADAQCDTTAPSHVVGIDRGLRFLAVTYDERGKAFFFNGRTVMAKREAFQHVRDELQAKGTKSAKRVLKRISGRENRWMSDVNHQISKTLVDRYGANTLFVIEDLAGVSFSEEALSSRRSRQRRDLRSWTFYQLEQFLTYKAHAAGSEVLKADAHYTSQRCPKCGRILKENRHHDTHEYVCDCCGYRSNDDRIGAMNIQTLGAMYVSGDKHPRFGARKEK
jgi:putative transposase